MEYWLFCAGETTITRSFFITATGTDIGKTFVACALIHQLQHSGNRVSAVKPIISGMADNDNSDLHQLAAALGVDHPTSLAHTHYQQPLSPDMAARFEKTAETSLNALTAFCQPNSATDFHLIEGAGGVAVPLNSTHSMLDLMTALNMPTILVAGHYLGSLSHTLTAVETLKTHNIPLHAIVVSDQQQADFPLAETITSLENFTNTPIYPLPFTVNNSTNNPWKQAANLTQIVL